MARQWEIGQKVFVKNYKTWEPAIVSALNPRDWRRGPRVEVKTKGWRGEGGYTFPRTVSNTRAFILTEEEGQPLWDQQHSAELLRKQAEKERAARQREAEASPLYEHVRALRRLTYSRHDADTQMVKYLEKHFAPFVNACESIEQVSRKHREKCEVGAPDCRECNLALYARVAIKQREGGER